jgi:hypothetical protein
VPQGQVPWLDPNGLKSWRLCLLQEPDVELARPLEEGRESLSVGLKRSWRMSACASVSLSMASLEARLDPARFVRVSRSSIVNADRVRELQPMFNGDFVVVLRDGTKVAGSRRYRAAFDMLTR